MVKEREEPDEMPAFIHQQKPSRDSKPKVG
jgi:hypothetical protein